MAGAAEEFLRRYSADIARVATRFSRAGSVDADDLVQIVTTRLLLPAGEKPARLSLYRGQGPIAGFVRVTAARLAINTVDAPSSTAASEPENDLFAALVSPAATPEAEVSFARCSAGHEIVVRRVVRPPALLRHDDRQLQLR